MKKYSLYSLIVLAFLLLLSACHFFPGTMRYPDLNRIEKNAVCIRPTKIVMPALDLKTEDTSAVQLKFSLPETMHPFALLASHNTGVKSVPLKKVIFKSLRLHRSLPKMIEMKRLISSSMTPPYALVVFLIVLMSICLAWGILILLLSTTGQPGCLIPLFLIAAVCGILIIIFLN